jgi:CRP-like cAMP-binding protein/Fe-S-cluster-containing hydrogenase component 2
MTVQENAGKLAGEVLSTDRLLEFLPFLKEILESKELSRSQLDNFAKDASSLRRFRAGDIICQEGDFGSTAFYLVSGRVEISINNPVAQLYTRRAGGGHFRKSIARLKKMTSFLVKDEEIPRDPNSKNYIPIDASVDLPRERPIAELGAGEIFGEMTCRTFQPRSATVTAMEDCVMVEMLRVILDMLTGNRAVTDAIKASTKVKAATFKGSPTFRKLIDDKYRERTLTSHLRSVPMFAGLDDAFLAELTREVDLVSFGAGEAIVTQGQAADAFYMIRGGMVKVSQDLPGGEIVRTYLAKGDFFGEIGLISADGKRTATCRALDQTDVVRMKRDLFERVLEKYPAVRVQLRLIADARLKASAARQAPTGMNMDEYLDQGLFEAQNLLLIDLDKCTRCDACVNACAEAHDGVTRLLRDGLRYDRYLVATACRSCHDPLCMTQCPVGSIRRKDSLEIVIESWCIGCSKCAELCPFGNINMHPFEVAPKPPPKPAAPAAAAKPAAAPAAKPAAPAVAAAAKPAVAAAPKPAAAVANAAAPAPAAAAPVAAKPVPAETPKPVAAPIAARADKPTSPVAVAEAATVAAVAAVAAAKPPAPAAAPKPAAPAAAPKPAAPAAAAKPAAAPAAAAKPPAKPDPKKKPTALKATVCDLCTDLVTPSCVYACPHDAAMRIDPARYFAGQKSAQNRRRRSWLQRLIFADEPDNRTTH